MKVVNTKNFLEDLFNFDLLELSVLNNGEVIYGDKSLVNRLKEESKKAPITQASVEYNLRKAEIVRKNLEEERYSHIISAVKTIVVSLVQAKALAQGKKFLRIEDLEKEHPEVERLIKRY